MQAGAQSTEPHQPGRRAVFFKVESRVQLNSSCHSPGPQAYSEEQQRVPFVTMELSVAMLFFIKKICKCCGLPACSQQSPEWQAGKLSSHCVSLSCQRKQFMGQHREWVESPFSAGRGLFGKAEANTPGERLSEGPLHPQGPGLLTPLAHWFVACAALQGKSHR